MQHLVRMMNHSANGEYRTSNRSAN